jgi:hypothetical protein
VGRGMDSGNSGSDLQSSSGGGDEFDCRGGVDSSPLSAALLRPASAPSTSAFSPHGSLYGLQEFASAAPPQQEQSHQAGLWSESSTPRADQGARRQAETTAQALGSAPPPAQQPPPRGSRKRTRASRRAPTTVLTTDTSNFRAMVQEFTGIPSPPFAPSPAAALRTRFDHIFPPPSSSLRAAAGDAALLPPYLLRPFAQKLPSSAPASALPPFTTSSSSTLSFGISAAIANAAKAAAAGASSNPSTQADMFQLTSSALLRLQDPSNYLSFQNLLESQSSSLSIFGAAGGGFAAQAPQQLHEPAPSPSEFLASTVHGGLMGSEGLHLQHPRSDVQHGGDELSGVVASGSSCKLNYSTHAGTAGSSSTAAGSGDKPPVAGAPGTARPARTEGLDPWICTSE